MGVGVYCLRALCKALHRSTKYAEIIFQPEGATAATFEFSFTKMEIQKALISVQSKIKDICFGTFRHKIVFGKLCNEKFEEFKCFELSLSELSEIFCGLFQIVKAISTNSENEGNLCKKSSQASYAWKVSINSGIVLIQFFIKQASTINFEVSLNTLEFNDLILLLGNLILPSLVLPEGAHEVFVRIINLDLDQILKFRNENAIKTFLEKHLQDFNLSRKDMHHVLILVHYHLDVIVAIHNIKSLYNPSLNLTLKNIDRMLSCQ